MNARHIKRNLTPNFLAVALEVPVILQYLSEVIPPEELGLAY